jgi:uncharacterized protein (TIGR01777 family)
VGRSVRVGVTGSTGLIGLALVRVLHERGDHVTVFVRPGTASNEQNTIRWDPKQGTVNQEDLRRSTGFDVLINLAGAGIGDHRWNPSRTSAILESRISATSLLVQTLSDLTNDVVFLASASAIGWYGSRGEEVLNESSIRGEGFLAGVCQQWEKEATCFATSGSSVALLRTGLVISRRGGLFKRQLPLFRLGLGGHYGSGRQWLSPISLHDEVRAILWTIDHQLSGPINLTAPSPTTNRTFTATLARTVHRPARMHVPQAVLRAALGAEMTNELVLTSQRVAPEKLLSSGFCFEQPDIDSIFLWALHDKT